VHIAHDATTNMKRAVLLPNMVEFPSESMKRYAAELSGALRNLDAPDWEFDVLECHQVERALRSLPGEQGVKMASRLGRFVRYPQMARAAARDPRSRVFHVLDHSHANLTLSLPGDKTVLTCHDIIPHLAAKGIIPIPAGRATRYSFPQRIRCMKRCRYVIAISESTKRDLIEHAGFPEERIAVVYYGVNPAFRAESPSGAKPEDVRRNLLRQYQIPEDARVLLHVGTATRYKNTPTILRALALLRSETTLGDRTYLIRVGAPFFDDEAALIETLGIRDRIVHAGKIFDDQRLADHYRSADVFFLPSLWEGFGWPPLEAMACGTPVVTSNVASLPEVVGEGGITVAPTDLDAFNSAVLRVLTNDKLRADLSVRALAQAARFTWEQCARDTLAVYEKIAAGS
jgi:glycosyltransferase involved in cell wall biosynthesis